jgi:hypothetical protein
MARAAISSGCGTVQAYNTVAVKSRVVATTAVPPAAIAPVPVSIGLSRSEPVKIYLTGIATR